MHLIRPKVQKTASCTYVSHHSTLARFSMAALMSRLSALAIAPASPKATSTTMHALEMTIYDTGHRIQKPSSGVAISPKPQILREFEEGQGVNHDVHDFPTAELGLKMGGFMLLHREGGMICHELEHAPAVLSFIIFARLYLYKNTPKHRLY